MPLINGEAMRPRFPKSSYPDTVRFIPDTPCGLSPLPDQVPHCYTHM